PSEHENQCSKMKQMKQQLPGQYLRIHLHVARHRLLDSLFEDAKQPPEVCFAKTVGMNYLQVRNTRHSCLVLLPWRIHPISIRRGIEEKSVERIVNRRIR